MIKNKKLKIAIFIPAYHHVKTLPSVIDRIPKKIKNEVEEIFVIDDASSDNTYLLAKGYKIDRKLKKLYVYKNEKNKGYGGNQKKGYQYAINKGYDIVVMLHGDGQYAPEVLPKLLKPFYEGNVDMVFGSRMKGNPLKGGMPIYKYLGNKILTFIENLLLGLNLSEYHSGYRIYNCHALKKIPFNLCANDFHFDTEILIQFKEKNLKIIEKPIPTYYGDEISYVNVISYGLNCLKSTFLYKLQKFGLIKIKKFDIK
jgi:glycosyltransferase involved in cell wall biosynthesis